MRSKNQHNSKIKQHKTQKQPHMYCQHVLINKFLLTIITAMFFLPTVHPPQMIIQIAATFKSFRAHLTHTQIICMCGHVHVNRRRCPARVTTQFTGIQSLIAVRLHVHLHGGFRGEFFAARLANVIFYVRVNGDHVLGECGARIKTTRTLITPEVRCVLKNQKWDCKFYYMCLSVCFTKCSFKLLFKINFPHCGHGLLWFLSCSSNSFL